MKIDISKYLKEKYEAEKDVPTYGGPVVTISREAGCPGKRLASLLVDKLNTMDFKFEKRFPWKYITKEMLEDNTARELGVDFSEIQYVFDYVSHGVIEDLLLSHSKKYYKSDRKIRNTIAKIIRNYAEEGNKVILGRGGVSITKDIPKSIHVFLQAPLEWRSLRMSEKHELSIDQAKKLCNDIDKKRKQFIDYYHGMGTDYSWYDITFNAMSLDSYEMTDIIIESMKIRKII